MFPDLLRVLSSRQADEFRQWFQNKKGLSEVEIITEYIALLKQVPRIERLPSKILRFAITTAAGFFPVVGNLVDVFDSFIINRLFRGRSPKFFIDDLTAFTGELPVDEKK